MSTAHTVGDGEAPGAQGRLSPLLVYGYYRILLAAALFLLFIVDLDRSMRLGSHQPGMYLAVSTGYFLVCIVSTITMRRLPDHRDRTQGLLLTGIDIVALTMLAHASGGPSSTVAPLLVVTVAAGAILLPGRLGLLPAAVASLAILYEQFYFSLSRGLPLSSGSTLVGLLGLAFFGVAIAIAQLSRRLQESEALARRRSQEVSALEDLNSHIIQRMRTGILVVESDGRVRLANSAAQNMLGHAPWPERPALTAISPELARRVEDWQRDDSTRRNPFRNHPGAPEISANMTSMLSGNQRATLVFIDDMTAFSQHLQQMKLASLGRLAASIAHEIRNPLAAISHAAQLLNESPHLPREDLRLAEIVQQQALRLDRIVDNVLQLSRRQLPRSDVVHLGGWLRQFRADYLAMRSNDDEVELRLLNPLVKARLDSHHLQQVLQNLCDNGLRHGRKQTGRGKVVLECGIVDGTDEPFIRIIDNGPGIPPDQQANLFEPFFTTEAGGTGLGLYIARELCEANRARLAYIPGTPDGPGHFQITFSHPGRIAS